MTTLMTEILKAEFGIAAAELTRPSADYARYILGTAADRAHVAYTANLIDELHCDREAMSAASGEMWKVDSEEHLSALYDYNQASAYNQLFAGYADRCGALFVASVLEPMKYRKVRQLTDGMLLIASHDARTAPVNPMRALIVALVMEAAAAWHDLFEQIPDDVCDATLLYCSPENSGGAEFAFRLLDAADWPITRADVEEALPDALRALNMHFAVEVIK